MTGFHGNKILQNTIDVIIKQAGVTSFVETGTHYAATALYMAKKYSIPILTCEIEDDCYNSCLNVLRPYTNVRLSKESSEKFIARIIQEGVLGDAPLFFLDAHWYDYWPLPDEVGLISKLDKFIILIDDFAVPGQGQFETSAGGGGTVGVHKSKLDTRPCAMSLISPHLPQNCNVMYPAYGKLEAYGNPMTPHLVGYTIIMYNIQDIKDTMVEKFHTFGGIR